MNFEEIMSKCDCTKVDPPLAIGYKDGKIVAAETRRCLLDGNCGTYQACLFQEPEIGVLKKAKVDEIKVYGKTVLSTDKRLDKVKLTKIDDLPVQ